MKTRTIRVQFYGALRRYGDELALEITPETTASDLCHQVSTILGEESTELLQRCAVANDNRVLLRNERLDNEADLALLPPVSGG